MTANANNLDAVLSALGIVAHGDLLARLEIPEHIDKLDQVLSLAAGERLRLGEMLRAAERITPEQLDDALAEQRRSGRKLGAILVERGILTQRECGIALEFQRRQAEAARGAGKLNLGSILVATGQITRAQLDGALRRQATTHRRLGDELVVAGHASKEQVELGLSLQRKLVVCALNIALWLASSSAVVSDATAGEAKASMRVSALVASWAPAVQVDYQAAQLTVTPEDVARGYVEAPGASRFRILGGARSGWLIDFFARGQIFTSAQIEGLGGIAQVSADGGTLFQGNPSPDGVTRLSYRFNLGADVKPGRYQWPLAMSVRTQ